MKPSKRDYVNVCRETHVLPFSGHEQWGIKRLKALVKEHDNRLQTLRAFSGQVKPSDPPKYFLTFQGIRNNGLDGASYVRSNLEAMLNVSINRPELSGCPRSTDPSLTSVPSDVFIAIADKAQRHKEMRHPNLGAIVFSGVQFHVASL